MADRKRPVLVTGASGELAGLLIPGLLAAGFELILTDLRPFPGEVPKGARFIAADLTDRAAFVAAIDAPIQAIMHLGGIRAEGPADLILEVNFGGALSVYELAHAKSARVVFASSNHVIGFHTRETHLTIADPYRPDSHYGLSKLYTEMLGRLYLDKNGVESVHLRIGSCLQRPLDTRHLSTWLSPRDFIALVVAAIDAPEVGNAIVWGISANTRAWWSGDDAARIGYVPQDNSEIYADSVKAETGEPIALAHQGGVFCVMPS